MTPEYLDQLITLIHQSVHPDRNYTDKELAAFYKGRSETCARMKLIVDTLQQSPLTFPKADPAIGMEPIA